MVHGLAGEGVLSLDAAQGCAVTKVLTVVEVQRVPDGFLVAKYRVFFALIYATGLRIARRARWAPDINAFKQVSHVRNETGCEDRLLPMQRSATICFGSTGSTSACLNT